MTADPPIDPHSPLVVVDVDEVLALFMAGFERFVGGHGLEMRIDKFALFQNIYPAGSADPIDLARGRELFDAFFRDHAEAIDPAPGAAAALARIAERASIVILTNAPQSCRAARARWLATHGFPYPLLIGEGLKGPAVAALAARTAGPAAFVDDLLPHLESTAQAAPDVHRFQTVADVRLRPFAVSDPERHPRIDAWPELGERLAAALGL